ncbi:Levodione reductase [Zhongshania aliphaticivorans]|uniref:Levodione reductase n=1 Tax=Zhongshania aliphaticivorans TaxID=1470434 RepID=A0A5S9MT64_9GAMM|nr:glucose 1-dehydrogenase [Zhongshania aliphaticivorans]CAA0079456.1 Levodione reductase [Zhongshania aliphaticivorans]CAA0086138.1 Levodione reductase [Zhongshania aliphaticivorans]
MDTTQFNNKVILITGAASGFGKIMAEKLSVAGAQLVLGDINAEGLEQVVSPLREAGADIVSQRCDVTVESDMATLVEAAVNNFGRLDIAVNNAGAGTAMKLLIDMDEAEFDFNINVNAKSVFFGMKYQIRQMLTQEQGIVLNVASMAGLGAAPKLSGYGAAKHAVVGLTKTAAVEYARKGIRVNAVCPFFSPTPLVTNAELGGMQDLLAQGSPMKRLGTPEEMVEVMFMLMSPDNSYMNGQAIAVDGGTSAL